MILNSLGIVKHVILCLCSYMYMYKKMNVFICFQSVYNMQVAFLIISVQHKKLGINETIFIFAL